MKQSRFNLPIPYGWFAIAIADQLAIGDVKPLHYFDRELVLFRTESGQAKLLNAICPHLGAHIGHGGEVHGESVACPFHGWEYNGDGYCTQIAYAKAMPPKVDGKQIIQSYPVVERNGVVWAWYHPDNIDPLFEVDLVEEFNSSEWTVPFIREWDINCPVQEAAENAVDKAHFAYVHTADAVPEGVVTVDAHRRTTHLDSRGPGFNDNGERVAGAEPIFSHLQSVNVGAGQTWQRFSGIFETVMMGTVTPIDADSFRLRFIFTQPKANTAEKGVFAQGFMDEICHQVEQDIPIWDHKHYQPTPLLCDGDGPIAQFRKWFSQFYADGAPQQ
ncbi:MAG: Rieske 2Fe-2S domain-containing protein [Pseudomonadales bacterium]